MKNCLNKMYRKFLNYFIMFITLIFLILFNWEILGRPNPLVGVEEANNLMIKMKNFSIQNDFKSIIKEINLIELSSFLWILIGSLIINLSSFPEKFLLFTNIVFIFLLVIKLSNYLERNSKSIEKANFFSAKQFWILAFLGFTPGFIDWTILSLMETGIWSLLISLITIKTIQIEKNKSLFQLHFQKLLYYLLMLSCKVESILFIPLYFFFKSYKKQMGGKNCYI